MPLYNVLFHTSTETVYRQYLAASAEECLTMAEDQFRRSNADHGELHEVVVMPPDNRPHLDSRDGLDGEAAEYFYLTPEGRRAVHAAAAAALANLPLAQRLEQEQLSAEIHAWRRRRRFS